MKPIITLDLVTKRFPPRRGALGLRGRGGLGDLLRGVKAKDFTALQDISMEIRPGESLGIIGRNGSGKSTLLSLIAGVTLPTSGRIQVFGRVASLLELGAGFNPVLTGRENIYLNAGLLGMRHAQVDAVFDEIVRFSGIEEFIDQPVATYSSGMYVRIGFSVAAFVNPDIFLADEVLAVGDEDFQRKCRRKIGELREQGKTILFVSHDLSIVNTLCERVILLDKGRIIQRDTPQKTITYYLRQVGRDKGVHTFSDGDLEAIHCDGRISLFHKQEEITAPTGFTMKLQSLGRYHSSVDAEWVVVERNDTGCRAEGRMVRLPIRLIWIFQIEKGVLLWQIAMEVEQHCTISRIDVECLLPLTYETWLCGRMSGTFPELQPNDITWNVVAAPEAGVNNCAALPPAESSLPAVAFQMEKINPHFGLYWANTDYMAGSRILDYSAHFHDSREDFAPKTYSLLNIRMDTTLLSGQILDQLLARDNLDCGHLKARFEQGRIYLFRDDRLLTDFHHVYSSMLIAHLWNDSQNLAWQEPENLEGKVRIRGKSRRFPFAQEWELIPQNNALDIRVWLDVEKELEVQEYHFSVVLQSAYSSWITMTESGSFPDFNPETEHWIHLNRSYDQGSAITATSESLPTIVLSIDDHRLPMRQTVLNTGYNESARVLQMLHPSGKTGLHFSPGRHLYFSGSITLHIEA